MYLSVVIPAKNEEKGLRKTIPELLRVLSGEFEIIVVNDGGDDDSLKVLAEYPVTVIEHKYSKGNGAAIKSGLRAASGEIVVCMDADGQHQPKEIPILVAKLEEGYDMVVGARNRKGQAGVHRSLANGLYNRFASWVVGHKIEDLTSGFRAVKREMFLEFISLLPNKFSYPTTVTMSFFRAGYSVGYVPIEVLDRVKGTKSHINITQDGVRFLLIVFKIGTLFSPLKIFTPVSLALFLMGCGYYGFTFITAGRFTNMSALLFTTSLMIFLLGLISEQITALLYRDGPEK
ncbi:glycosyltransferase family 2 protein [Teredinibacter purpureus]|uniref:glycosyltransferase family 2 protein n=1 Tax=Teredinibacter purpureus TaxID=2731756 RepID=UPI0005F876C6|nr:glycosyltransferase family 2 protein [Teredinibacter purpureus]